MGQDMGLHENIEMYKEKSLHLNDIKANSKDNNNKSVICLHPNLFDARTNCGL